MQRLTKQQSAIISAYTGILCGNFADIDMHEYVEKRFQRPVFTHEMGSPEFMSKLQELSKEDFLSICYKAPVERRFVHVNGFTDGTECIAIRDGKVYAITAKEEKSLEHSYKLERCLEFVAEGAWKEIT